MKHLFMKKVSYVVMSGLVMSSSMYGASCWGSESHTTPRDPLASLLNPATSAPQGQTLGTVVAVICSAALQEQETKGVSSLPQTSRSLSLPSGDDAEKDRLARLQDQFLTHIRRGDLESVRQLYEANKQHIHLDPLSEDGYYKEIPLYLAISQGHEHIVDWLLTENSSLLSKQSMSKTEDGSLTYLLSPVYYALQCALKRKASGKEFDFGMVRTLYARGASVHTTQFVKAEDVYKTPAAQSNNVSEGMSLLGFAAQQKDTDALRFLLEELEWDVNSVGEDGKAPLRVAVESDNEAALAFLLARPDIDLTRSLLRR